MKYLILSDIHGNNIALNKVLASVPRDRYQTILVLGDNLGDGPCPDKVLQTLQQYDALLIQGNREQLAIEHFSGNPSTQKAMQWNFMRRTLDYLTPAMRDGIAVLPPQRSVSSEGLDLLMVHGSPFSVRELLYPTRPDRLSACLDAIPQHILLCGHNHLQFTRIIEDKLVLNPGSVGLCQTGEHFRADYALLEVSHGQYKFALHHTYYDGQAVCREYEDRELFDDIWGKIAYREMSEGRMYIIGFARYVMEKAKAAGLSIQPIPDEIWLEASQEWDWQPA